MLKTSIRKIILFGLTKGFHTLNPTRQINKVVEEVVEVQDELKRDRININHLMEEIGDCAISTIMFCLQYGIKQDEIVEFFHTACMYKAYNEPMEEIKYCISDMLNIQANVIFKDDKELVEPFKITTIDESIVDAMYSLNAIASCYDLTLEECIEHSLKKINNRDYVIKDGKIVSFNKKKQ